MTKKPPPVEAIAAICHVSKATAYRWKRSPETIPTGYKSLLDLHTNGQIIPENWKGFYFDKGKLWTPIDKSLHACEAEQLSLFMSFYRETTNENDRLRDYIEYLESVTPRALVIPFPAERTRPSATIGHELNKLFNKNT